MSKGKYAKKRAPFVDLYGVLLLIATLAMSIAYAEIVGTEITISTKAEATAQEGVFITDVICNESNSVSNNYMATTLDSSHFFCLDFNDFCKFPPIKNLKFRSN